jgi:hypothetical protein
MEIVAGNGWAKCQFVIIAVFCNRHIMYANAELHEFRRDERCTGLLILTFLLNEERELWSTQMYP